MYIAQPETLQTLDEQIAARREALTLIDAEASVVHQALRGLRRDLEATTRQHKDYVERMESAKTAYSEQEVALKRLTREVAAERTELATLTREATAHVKATREREEAALIREKAASRMEARADQRLQAATVREEETERASARAKDILQKVQNAFD